MLQANDPSGGAVERSPTGTSINAGDDEAAAGRLVVRKDLRLTRELPRQRGRRLNSVRARSRMESPDECRGWTEGSQLDDAPLPPDSLAGALRKRPLSAE